MTPRLSCMLSPADLPIAELSAARLDGDVFPIADGFSPVDLPEGTLARALALVPQLTARLIVERHTAAWVFGASDLAPTVLQFCSSADARAKPVIVRGLSVREVVIDDDELVTVGPVRLTSPLRTACDLVRSAEDFDATTRLIVERLLDMSGATVDDCVQLLDRRRNLPGKRQSLARLRTLRQPLLTR